jgi:LacI family transcriptional regulator
MKRVTIKDVAQAAQVSLSTVSRVLNNNLKVDTELAQRVQGAVEKLNYQRNRSAQRLRSNTGSVIGLIISDVENPFFTSVVRGVEDIAYEHNMSIILCNTDEDVEKQKLYLRVMSEERVAGLIVASTSGQTLDSFHQHVPLDTPIVFIDRDISEGSADSVTVDNTQGAYTAVKHLISLGRKRIAMISGDFRIKPFFERYEGYRKALEEANLPVYQDSVRIAGLKTEGSFQGTLDLLNMHPEHDAIFAANNMMTLGVLKAVRHLNLEIPRDVAVVGFDDMPWSSELCPPITSVAQPTYALGQEAARLLIQRVQQPDKQPVSLRLKTHLIVRESCGGNYGESP